jgi:hypothetical protein
MKAMKRRSQKLFQLQLTYKEADMLLSLLDASVRARAEPELAHIRHRLEKVMDLIGED